MEKIDEKFQLKLQHFQTVPSLQLVVVEEK